MKPRFYEAWLHWCYNRPEKDRSPEWGKIVIESALIQGVCTCFAPQPELPSPLAPDRRDLLAPLGSPRAHGMALPVKGLTR